MNLDYEQLANRDAILIRLLTSVLKKCQQRVFFFFHLFYLVCFLVQQRGDVVQPCCWLNNCHTRKEEKEIGGKWRDGTRPQCPSYTEHACYRGRSVPNILNREEFRAKLKYKSYNFNCILMVSTMIGLEEKMKENKWIILGFVSYCWVHEEQLRKKPANCYSLSLSH